MSNHIYRLGICKKCGTTIETLLLKEHDELRFNKPINIIQCPIDSFSVEMIKKDIPEFKIIRKL